MPNALQVAIDDLDRMPRMPAWVTSTRPETAEDVAFLSGAALNHLHLVLNRVDLPHALLRDRLALRAAEAFVAFSGRPEREAALRDAVPLLRPGDLPGPAGETYLSWRRAAERPVSIKALGRALPTFEPGQIATWLDAGQGAPVGRAARVLEAVLTEAPRADVPALVLADAALAQALGWEHLVPLLAPGLKRADLRKQGETQAAGQGGWRRGRDVPDPRRRGAFGLAFAGSRRAAALRPAGRPWCGARADRARHFPALRGVAMAKDRSEPDLDRELADLPPELRWREWMRRIEAVLFASASPVPREDLVRVVGQGVSVDLLVEDLAADLEGRAFEVAQVAGGWIFRTRPAYAPAIRAAADVGDQLLELSEFDVAVLAAIAYHQPITRDGLKDIFGKEISRDLIGRLHARDLIGTGPRSPRRGAPYSFVTTEQFLIAFGLESLRDLPDREQLDDAGLVVDV